jgi:hypothetical protein
MVAEVRGVFGTMIYTHPISGYYRIQRAQLYTAAKRRTTVGVLSAWFGGYEGVDLFSIKRSTTSILIRQIKKLCALLLEDKIQD